MRFGMRRADVHGLLGKPEASRPIWDKSGVTDFWSASRINVGYDNDTLVKHVGFSPGGYELLVRGQRLWSTAEQPDPNPFLLRLDPAPVESLGFLIFVALGVSTSGYHDDDEAQLAVTVSPPGKWDNALKKARPAKLEKYRAL